jgi:hypothetical protein
LGDAQFVNRAAPSRRHLNVEPTSEDVKPKFAVVLFVKSGGPEVIAVLGGAVSASGAQVG